MKSRGAYLTLGAVVLAGAASTSVFLLSSDNNTDSPEKNQDVKLQEIEGKGPNDTNETGTGKGNNTDKEKVGESTVKATTLKSSSGSIDPLSDSLPNSNIQRTYDSFKTEVWGCTKKLFPEAAYNNILHDKTEYSYFNYTSWLDWNSNALKPILNGHGTDIYQGHDLTSKQQNQTIGCAIAQIKPATGTKNLGHYSDYYFKSEIVVKNDRIGLILWTDWVTARGQYDSAMTHRMLLMVNKGYKNSSENWEVAGGLWWNDYNATYPATFSRDHYIRMPGESSPWYKTRDQRSVLKGTHTWSGIWVVGESGGKPVYQDFHVSSVGEHKSELLGAKVTPFQRCHPGVMCGWHYGGYYYETRDNYAPGWWGFVSYHNIQANLYSWYRPFMNVKGTWQKPKDACASATSSNNDTLKKLCATDDKKSASKPK